MNGCDGLRSETGEEGRSIDNGQSNSLLGDSWDPNYKPNREALSQEEIYDKIAQSETGQQILEQIDEIGERPTIIFTNEGFDYSDAAAHYDPVDNLIRVRPELQELPEEAILVLSHTYFDG